MVAIGWRYLGMASLVFLLIGTGHALRGDLLGALYLALGIVVLCAAFLRWKR